MGQIFSRRFDRGLRRAVWVVLLFAALSVGGSLVWARSDSRWHVGKPEPQPIPFRHNLHVAELKIPCGYCHTGAEATRSAGMPSTQTCLTCHTQIWRGVPTLAPLHQSAPTAQPIEWRSVSRLPTHVRFHHGSHAQAGISCSTCHGRVETMSKTVKTETLNMGWCLDCHRNPAGRDVPLALAQETERARRAIALPAGRAPGRVPPSHVDGRDLTDCSVCHY